MYPAVVTLVILGAFGCATVAAFWLASFLLYASLHHNPLHAGLWGWWDAVSAWHDGRQPKVGRKLAGAAVLGVLIAFGGPPFAWWAIRNGAGKRELHGSAKFATEADIRRAGLL
jgi:hypothetical protein